MDFGAINGQIKHHYVDSHAPMTYDRIMKTIIETPIFSRMVVDILTEGERQALAAYLANNPSAGAVIPQSGGCRKMRWQKGGTGKRGGARVIYYNQLDSGVIYLLLIYSKAKTENIPSHILKQIKGAL